MLARSAFFLTIATLAGPALAADETRKVGDWTVVAHTPDNGATSCVLLGPVVDGNRLRLQNVGGGGNTAAAHPDSARLSIVSTKRLIDGASADVPGFAATVPGVVEWKPDGAVWREYRDGGSIAATLATNIDETLPALAAGHSLVMSYAGGEPVTLSLAGSSNAISVYRDCLEKIRFDAAERRQLAAGLREELAKDMPDRGSILFFRKYGITQFRRAPDAGHALFARVESGAQPVAHLFDARSGEITALSDGIAIAFDPAVNSNGSFAYVLYEWRLSESRLFLNRAEIGSRKGLYKALVLTGENLIAHYRAADDDRNYIYSYRLSDGEEHYLEVGFYVESFAVDPNGVLLVQGVPATSFGNLVFDYDPTLRRITSRKPDDEEQCFLDIGYDGGAAGPTCFDEGARPQHLRFLAMRHLRSWDPALTLACSNNDLGRLSWHVAYRLAALARFREQLEPAYPLREVVEGAVACLLEIGEADHGDNFGWPTRRYSLEPDEPLSLMVNNATVLYALLFAAGQSLASESQTQRIVALARALHERYEPHYRPDAGGYRIPKGISFQLDGLPMPFNMQNIYGRALLELHRLTGEDRFRERARELAAAFRGSWTIADDGAALWHYWPDEFYRGWSEEDGVSVNTPSRAPSESRLFEDLSHASHNVKFALDAHQRFGDAPISRADIEAVARTLERTRVGAVYSRFMGGDTEVSPASSRYLPAYAGWIEFADDRLLDEISGGVPAWLPPFDGDPLYAYLAALARIAP